MAQEEVIVFAIRLAAFAVALLAGALCLFQRRLSPAYNITLVMFMAFMAGQLIYIADTIWPNMHPRAFHVIHMISYVTSFLFVPTLAFHLFAILRPNEPIALGEIALHLAFPGLVLALACWSMFVPIDVVTALRIGQPSPTAEPWMVFAITALMAVDFGVYAQVLIYSALVYRIQRANRKRLETVFSSNRTNEGFWIIGVACAMVLYLVQAAVFFFWVGERNPQALTTIEESLAVLFFVGVVAARAMRQAPGLYGTRPAFAETPRANIAKYSKSALADEHAQRIAGKLDRAMSQEQLYADPNLSLTKLAKHVGSTPNYVSQTLNEHMQKSFFDFVNHWRIKEAERLLVTGEQTILDVAYQVGFNSRSAFYTAFKKQNGMTPTGFREKNAMSGETDLPSKSLRKAASRV